MTDHIAADQSGVDELKQQAERMQWLLRQLAMSFPSQKDWLDPSLEKETKYWATAALSSNAAQSAGQGPVAVAEFFEKTWPLADEAKPRSSSYDQGWFDGWNAMHKEAYKFCAQLYTHPSSAAQVEEIRDAALEDLATKIEASGYKPEVKREFAAFARQYKTAAPSKGEE